MCDIRLNDIGTAFTVSVYDETDSLVDLTPYSGNISFLFSKPDNTLIERNGVITYTGASGITHYTSQSGDINVAGLWQLQCKLVNSPSQFYTDIYEFRVSENLE